MGGIVYSTPDWPYDLTLEQRAEEERAIQRDISETCKRIAVLLRHQIEEMLHRALSA